MYQDQIGYETTVENPSMKSLRETFHPAKGFGGNPIEKESWWKMTPGMVKHAEHYGVMADILQQAHDMDMISYQSELLKGYDRFYTGNKGGYIDTAKNYERSEKEITAAKRLADDGHTVYMLPRSHTKKSPDLLIDNQIGEIKHMISSKSNAIDFEVRNAGHKMTHTLFLQPTVDTSKETLKGVFKNRLDRSKSIEKIIVNFQNKLIVISREKALSGDW